MGEESLLILAVVVFWAACGVLAWAALLADFYEIGERFSSLGTPDEQWDGGDRREILWLASVMAALGPLGLISGAIATRGFRHGFRWW